MRFCADLPVAFAPANDSRWLSRMSRLAARQGASVTLTTPRALPTAKVLPFERASATSHGELYLLQCHVFVTWDPAPDIEVGVSVSPLVGMQFVGFGSADELIAALSSPRNMGQCVSVRAKGANRCPFSLSGLKFRFGFAILFEPGKLNYTILSNDTLVNPTNLWSSKVSLSSVSRVECYAHVAFVQPPQVALKLLVDAEVLCEAVS
jgi:hypothetical protein